MIFKSIFIGALVLASSVFAENLTDKLSGKAKEIAQVRANVLKGKASFSDPMCNAETPFCNGDAGPCTTGEPAICTGN